MNKHQHKILCACTLAAVSILACSCKLSPNIDASKKTVQSGITETATDPAVPSGLQWYLSPTGDDAAAGTVAAPWRSLERALKAVRESGKPAGTTIWLADGTYAVTRTLTLDAALSGTEQAPFTIRAVHDGQAVLSGAVNIPAADFKPVPAGGAPASASFLQAAARNQVVAARVKEPIAKSLSAGNAMLASGANALTLARWPNAGYAHAAKILSPGAVWMDGRTKTPRPTSSKQAPIGGEFTLREKWSGDWTGELAADFSAPILRGYFCADWNLESSPIASVTDGRVKLVRESMYGFKGTEKLPRRVFVSGMLSELDQPGEWFFDKRDGWLYVWPLQGAATDVAIAGGHELISLKKASHVVLRGLAMQDASTALVATDCESVSILGCTLRNLSGTAARIIGGRNSRVQSCDIHHCVVPLVVAGTKLADYKWDTAQKPPRIVPDGFIITNNHIHDCTGHRGLNLGGAGILFSHNLIHDMPGGAVGWGGNDIVFEYNEYYSVLKELGDWGVTYTGAQWASFGNVNRYNFLHHVFSLPQAHPVNGFYYDDLDAGDTTFGNVFYKVGHRSVLCNGGAAQTVTNNIFIKNYINVYQTGTWTDKVRAEEPKYESGELKRGDKWDFRWRTEQICGVQGWTKAPWSEAYPDFKRMMESDPFSPVLMKIAQNYSMDAIKDTIWLNKVPDGMVDSQPMMPITDEAFVNPAALNFAFRPEFVPAPGFQRIPFEKIGLRRDEYRPDPPDKDTYRSRVREENQARAPYDPAAIYDAGVRKVQGLQEVVQ